jgi:hypothetical protein
LKDFFSLNFWLGPEKALGEFFFFHEQNCHSNMFARCNTSLKLNEKKLYFQPPEPVQFVSNLFLPGGFELAR